MEEGQKAEDAGAPGAEPVVPVALVTGASGAIGTAVACAFAGAGYALGLVYHRNEAGAREAARLAEAQGRSSGMQVAPELFPCDVRDPKQCGEVVEQTVQRFGRLDVLVNCAGITRDELFVKSRDEDWRELINVNLLGAAAFARAALRVMMRSRSGCIVNVSSIAARVPAPGQAAYAASKGALEALTRALAVETGPKGIRVNAVAPGRIVSPMTEAVHRQEQDRLLERIPLRRYGTPDEVADLVGRTEAASA